MMQHFSISSILVSILLFTTSANAAFVSDRLYLGVYALPDTTSSLKKMLPSGSEVKVLEKEGEFVRIKSADGVEGWARAEFISEKTPASLTIKEITAQRDKLQAQLNVIGVTEQTVKRLQRQLAKANRQIKDLRKEIEDKQAASAEQVEQQRSDQTAQLEQLNQQLEESKQETLELVEEIQSLKNKFQEAGGSTQDTLTKIVWLLVTMFICLIVGIVLGAGWLERRVRKRFNGRKVW